MSRHSFVEHVEVMAASYQIAPPEPFNFSCPKEWTKWIRRFERFQIASGLNEKPQETQVNTLIYTMGENADEIFQSFGMSDEDKKDFKKVKEKFDAHFIPRRNVVFERAAFNKRKQEEGETVDMFVTSLYSLSEHCEYGNLREEMIRDRILSGMRDFALSLKLQLDDKLTLDKAVAQAREAEAIKKQQPTLRGDQKEKVETPANVGAVHKKIGGQDRGQRSNRRGPGGARRQVGGRQACTRCGRSPPHDRQRCPAKDAACHKCGKRGHFKAMCRSVRNVGEVYQDTDSASKEAFLGAVGTEQSDPWLVKVCLMKQTVEFHIDTGAEVSVIPQQLYNRLGRPPLTRADKTLKGPSNNVLPVKGRFSAVLSRGQSESKQEIYVATRLNRPLLGRPAIEALQLVQRVHGVQSVPVNPIQQFPSLFRGLGKLKGQYSIKLKEGAMPYALTTPRRVPIPLMKSVKVELERMESQGVISKISEPTEWCSGMVVVPKANGKVRICVDLTRLNDNVCRERHPLPAVDQTLAQLAGARVFSKLDANSGFWQIPLSPESIPLTTFITPFGRYCFHRLPFGITSAPEHFQRRMSEVLGDLEGVVCMMDDVLVHGRSQEEHDERLIKVLNRLQAEGLTLNQEKCKFSQSQVPFLGQVVNESGITPDPSKVAAIQNVRAPTGVGEVRRFLGTINQMSKFVPNLSDVTKPLRELLVKDNQWVWGPPQQKAFDQVKQMLTTAPILALFNPKLETTVAADASSYGLGAVLLQKQEDGELKPVAYISRSMTPTEQRYAQIEKEALAFTWACERFADYLIGLEFMIHTDHKPLVPLFSTKRLEELPIRVQRFRLRMMRYQFTITHIPGKDLVIADMLSRAPANPPSSDDLLLNQEARAFVNVVIQGLPASDEQLERIKGEQKQDDVCKQIKTYCKDGWPEKHVVTGALRPYYPMRAEIAIEDELLLRGSRIVIPASMRLEILDKIHTGHQGIKKCRERACQSVWWPGLSRQLEELVKNCPECVKAQKQRAQPLITSSFPDLPWQKVATDLFEWKREHYLLIVDYYSRFIEIALLKRTSAEEVIRHTKSIFARHGIPEVVVSDNGPQYSAEVYKTFAKEYQFTHVTSSPYHPQSNGEAERAVGTIKRLLSKGKDPYLAILSYRSTPLQNGFSPSELLMNRKLRTTVPMTREQRKPKVPDQTLVRAREEEIKRNLKRNYDRRYGVRELPELNPGDAVWIPDRKEEGMVQEEVAPRSYRVNTPEGTVRRNRRVLVRMPETNGDSADADESQPELQPESQPTDETTEEPIVRRSNRVSQPRERYDPSWK